MANRTWISKLSAAAAGVITFAVAGAADARPPWVGEGKPTAPPTVPAGLVVKCLQGPTVTTAAATCPVLKWDGHTFWAFSFADNRDAMVVVAYDTYKGMVKTWNLNGVKGIRSIYANVATKRVEFTGTGPKASLPWADLFVPQNPRWERRAGPPGATITQISVGNEGWVWALDTTGVPWRWNGKDWIKGMGTITAISATPDNSLWMSHAGNGYTAGRYKYATHQWIENVSGGMRLITGVNATKAYALDAESNNYEWDGSKWVKKGCCVTQIEAGGDGTLWALHSSNNNAGIRWTGTGWVPSSPEGTAIPQGMSRVSVGDAKNIWGLNGAGQPHYWDATNGWIGVPGQLKDISTAPDMTTWGLNSLGELYQWMQ